MMCVRNSHIKQVCDAVSSPFECHITYTRVGFYDLMSHSTKEYVSGMEQLHSVIIQPYIDYVKIRGCIFLHIEVVRSKLEESLKLHYISSRQILKFEVRCIS